MRPVGGTVLAVLMVLLTSAQSLSPIRRTEPTTIEATIETTTVPITTACPTIPCDDPNCFLENGPDGCPRQCICGDPICALVSCGPDETCVPSDENSGDYTCVPIYETTTAPPTPCPAIWCDDPNCYVENGPDGCPKECICGDSICMLVSCGPDETCVPSEENSGDYTCVSIHGTTRETTTIPLPRTTTETTTETTTGTTIGTPPPPVCPDVSSCAESSYCYIDYTYLIDGCPTCICSVKTSTPTPTPTPSSAGPTTQTTTETTTVTETTIEPTTETTIETPPPPTPPVCPDESECWGSCSLDYTNLVDGCPTWIWVEPTCEVMRNCGPDEVCGSTDENPYDIICVSKYGTTTETTPRTPTRTTTETTTETTIGTSPPTPPPVCRDESECWGSCSLDYTNLVDGCPNWIWVEPTCEVAMNCGPDEVCGSNDESPGDTRPICVSKYETTTTFCSYVSCGPYCDRITDSDGCMACLCQPETACQHFYCPDGEECFPEEQYCDKTTCYYRPTCIPISTTPTPTTTPTVTPTVWCPTVTCYQGCLITTDSNGCTYCDCPPSCENVTCDPGYVCELETVACFTTPCYPQPNCVPVQETTTPCPMFKCDPDCVPGTGPDGCPTCECPPSCETVKCSADHECQLVNVTCVRYPCFPQPQCVPVKNPCTGTPNTRRCGRFRNRWTYNSATDTCKRFRHYGCTPSLNTFLSPKACKNKCQGSSQIVCPTVVCEKNCYNFTRKNKCPKCICPNPCKGFKCREGYECKLKEAKCEDKDPKPFCARKPCPPQKEPCGIMCKYGFKTDKNGCPLCKCLEEPSPHN